jgi:hypothetical protein
MEFLRMQLLVAASLILAMSGGGTDIRLCEEAKQRIEADRPENVVIDSISFENGRITLFANSASANALANLGSNIKADPLFVDLSFDFVRQRKESSSKHYEGGLRFALNPERRVCR